MDLDRTDWKELVFRGVESDELDYKAAQDWDELPKSGRAKFVRHLLAFANTRGGYLVVGVGEDASGYPSKRTGLTPKQCASFDPSKVGAFVNRHVEPPIDFIIERPVVRGKRYAIFVVRPFKELPHVCSSGVEGELQTGVFYIRSADASSRPAHRALELSGMIRRALRNQREMLGRMLRGILYENRSGVAEPAPAKERFEDLVSSAGSYFRRRRQASKETIRLLFAVEPEKRGAFDVSELRGAVDAAGLPRPGGSFLTPAFMASTHPFNLGLRCLAGDAPRMWQLFKTGEFLFFADLPAPGGKVRTEDVLKFLSESVAFSGKLYSALELPDSLLAVTLRFSSGEKIKLRFGGRVVSRAAADRSSASLCRSAADLAAGDRAHASRLWTEFAVPFRIAPAAMNDTIRFIGEHLSGS
ncbi:MAG: ATP-binding protein [Lentisphaeria bacterium]|nr:ATP-binding protein [Lentisphaeria bacterium]